MAKKSAPGKIPCCNCIGKKALFAIIAAAIFAAIFLAFALSGAPPKLRVITEDFSPYNYVEDGEVMGPATQIVKEIMMRIGVKTEIEVMSWDEGYNIALTTPNVAIYSTLRTSLREDKFKWVGPIATARTVFFKPAFTSATIADLDSAKSLPSICVMKEDAMYQLLESRGFTNLVAYPNDIECVRKLATGEVAAWIGLDNSLEFMAERAGVDPEAIRQDYVISTDPMYIAFSKGTSDETVRAWQDALDAMMADGTLSTSAT